MKEVTIRIPIELEKDVKELIETAKMFEKKKRTIPTVEEIAEILHKPEDKIRAVLVEVVRSYEETY